MRRLSRLMAIATLLVAQGPWVASAGAQQTGGLALDRLIQQFDADAPPAPGSARLEAWAEQGADGPEVVIVVTPEGDTKLVADPGITVTPTPEPGVQWLLPMPHRLVDPSTDYFVPPATVRLPYASDHMGTVELRVEYAYCVVDFQCFFGEETLTVALDAD